MKAFYMVFSILLSLQTAHGSSFICESDLAVPVSVDGDFDQMTFKGELDSSGLAINLTVNYKNMVERNLNPNDCHYSLSITGPHEGSVALFCPGERMDREYISTSKLYCEISK
ncbi:MAG: hypothetical protein SGJ18_15350 [Pseudomonadota bacterium]|nr:hypothetical protein [Pseudomonadota bacterium]